MVTIEDLTQYYNKLTIIDKIRFRRMCRARRKMVKLETKLETIDDLLEELQ